MLDTSNVLTLTQWEKIDHDHSIAKCAETKRYTNGKSGLIRLSLHHFAMIVDIVLSAKNNILLGIEMCLVEISFSISVVVCSLLGYFLLFRKAETKLQWRVTAVIIEENIGDVCKKIQIHTLQICFMQ